MLDFIRYEWRMLRWHLHWEYGFRRPSQYPFAFHMDAYPKTTHFGREIDA